MTTMNAPALTPKQQQVLDLLSKGRKPADIAKRLKISPSGVHGHIRNIRAAGVEIPTNGRTADPPASPQVTATVEGHSPPEDSLQAAIDEGDARIADIATEVKQLEGRIADLGAERTALEGRREKLAAALGQLA